MKIFLALYFILLQFPLMAQNCPYYNKYISQGDAEIAKGSQANFEKAINAYSTAMTHCPNKAEEAKEKILRAFRAIEGLKQAAEKAEREALKEKEKATQNEKEAQTAKEQALLEKEKVKITQLAKDYPSK